MQELTPQQKKKLLKLAKLADEGNLAIAEHLFEIEEKMDAEIPEIKDIISRVKGDKGEKGGRGEKGDKGERGEKGFDGEKGDQGKTGKDSKVPGPKGDKGDRGFPGIDGKDGKDADEIKIVNKLEKELPQFGKSFRDGLELLKGKERLSKEAIKGLDDMDFNMSELTRKINASLALPPTTSFINGRRAKNFNISGAAVTYDGDTANITITIPESSPLTTKGDIYTYSTTNARLPVGSNNQVLIANSAATTGNSWSDVKTINGASLIGSGDIVIDATVTLLDLSANSTTAPTSIYNLTAGVPVIFKSSDANTMLYLDETNERIGIGGTPATGNIFEIVAPPGNVLANIGLIISQTGSAGTSDPSLQFRNGVGKWMMGLDDNVSDVFKICNAVDTLGTAQITVARASDGGYTGFNTPSVPSTSLHAYTAAASTVLRLERGSTTISAADEYGAIEFAGNDGSASANGVRAKIAGVSQGTLGETSIIFYTTVASSTTLTATATAKTTGMFDSLNGYEIRAVKFATQYETALNLSVGYNSGLGSTMVLNTFDANRAYNTFFGIEAGRYTSGSFAEANTVVGYQAMLSSGGAGNPENYRNTVMGYQAMGTWAAGSGYNVAIGYQAAYGTGSTLRYSTYIGMYAGLNSAFSGSIGIGYNAITTATNQLVIGDGAGTAYVSQGYFNGVTSTSPQNITLNAAGGSGTNIAGATFTIAGGKSTGNAAPADVIIQTSVAGGSGTTLQSLAEIARFIGNRGMSIEQNTTTHSVVLGKGAMNATATGVGNVVVGYNSGVLLSSGTENVIMGYQAAPLITTVAYSVYVGSNAGDTATGSGNIAIGRYAMYGITNGTFNVHITTQAAPVAASTNTSTSTIALGYNTYVTGNNQGVLGSNHSDGHIDNWYFNGVTAATVYPTVLNACGGSGTNIAGASLTFAGGKGTGNAAGGDIIFQTSDAGASGTTLQTLTTKMTLTELGNLGVGTTSPNVVATGKAITIQGAAAADARASLELVNSSVGTTSNIGGIRFYAGSDDLAVIEAVCDGATDSANIQFRTQATGGSLTERMRLTEIGLGVGVTAAAKMHALSTTEQLRLGYDASNYFQVTVGSAGSTTINLVGTAPKFTFSDPVGIGGTPLVNFDVISSGFGGLNVAQRTDVSTVSGMLYLDSSTSGYGIRNNAGVLEILQGTVVGSSSGTLKASFSTTGTFGIGIAPVATAFVKFGASTTGVAQFNLPTGSAPSAPVDGDVWREDNTNTGFKIRINGVTKTFTVA